MRDHDARQVECDRHNQSYSMNSPVHLSFRYEQSDFARAMRAHFANEFRLTLDITIMIAMAAPGAYFFQLQGWRWLGIVCTCVSAVFGLILVVAFAIIPQLVFRRDPKFLQDYSLTFSPEGIHFHTAHIDSRLQWSMYSRALVDAHSYVLYYGARSFTIIPKRVFQSAGEQETFEQLLAENVPKIIRRK
jgi:hypothetical protein